MKKAVDSPCAPQVELAAASLLLGYSARVAAPMTNLSDAARRSLIRPDVKIACSVDDMIWPDIWTLHQRRQQSRWVGYVQDLWASLIDLRDAADAAHLRPGHDYLEIAVTVRVSRGDTARWMARVGEFDPPCPPVARSLGFDVADEFLMSGLSNGTFVPVEDEQMRRRWGPLVNAVHLFTEEAAAQAFVPVAAHRYAEHAPFYCFEVLALTR
ncbi:MAG TPA: hypothetical protein VFS60_14465 [Thermoanaerobaculia bacterium]|nr:hypothetical protein [Thermoanaerobaculia bacterium]